MSTTTLLATRRARIRRALSDANRLDRMAIAVRYLDAAQRATIRAKILNPSGDVSAILFRHMPDPSRAMSYLNDALTINGGAACSTLASYAAAIRTASYDDVNVSVCHTWDEIAATFA